MTSFSLRNRLATVLQVAIVAALLLGGSPASAELGRFDFGPERTPVAEDFTAVTASTTYTAERGHGFEPSKTRFEHDINSVARKRRTVTLDPLTTDRVVDPGTFRVDLPDGSYDVAVFTGIYTSVYVSGHLHQALIGEHSIHQGTRELYHKPRLSVEAYFAPDGPYYQSYDVFYRPDQSLWDDYMAPRFPVIRFPVEVTDGKLELTFSKNFNLVGLMIWPASERDQGERALEQVNASRRQFFDEYYVRVPVVKDPPSLVATTEEETAGLVLFSRHPMMKVYPETVPQRYEVEQPLRAFATRGSDALMQLGCLPLRDLGFIEPEVSDLTGPETISAGQVEVRYARYNRTPKEDRKHYSVKPKYLMAQTRVPADGGVARSYFLRVSVPEGAAPGFYRGTVRVESTAGTAAVLPIELRVLPFTLPEPDIALGSYYSPPHGRRFRPYYFSSRTDDEALFEMVRREVTAMLALAREMGHNYVSLSMPGKPFTVDQAGEIHPTDMHRYLLMVNDAIRDTGFTSFSNFGVGWSKLMQYVPGFLSRKDLEGLSPDEVQFPAEAEVPAAAAIRYLYELREQRGWPHMIFYVADELGNLGPVSSVYGQHLAAFFKRIRPRVGYDYRLMSSTLRFSVGRTQLDSLDIISPNSAFPVTEQTIEAVRDAGVELWNYNMGESRLSFGYYQARIGSRGRQQWTLDWNGTRPDPFFGLGCAPAGLDCTIAPDFQPVPAHAWYVVAAEGIRDYRYLQLLKQKLREHSDHPAAEQAQEVIAELQNRVSVDYLDPTNNWQPGTYDYFRWQIAKAIMAFETP